MDLRKIKKQYGENFYRWDSYRNEETVFITWDSLEYKRAGFILGENMQLIEKGDRIIPIESIYILSGIVAFLGMKDGTVHLYNLSRYMYEPQEVPNISLKILNVLGKNRVASFIDYDIRSVKTRMQPTYVIKSIFENGCKSLINFV